MEGKYKNKYRIDSARLVGYDYSQNGLYFVTICTKERIEFFGEIINREMHLSEIGKIAWEELIQTTLIRKNVILDEWVVMPNHVHVILKIEKETFNRRDALQCENVSNENETPRRDALQCVSTVGNTVGNTVGTIGTIGTVGQYKNKFGPQINNLASIIRGFKGAVTNGAYKNGFNDFGWQSRFYDVVIRNEKSLNKIRQYIKNNPVMWVRDRNNQENLLM